MNIFTHSEFLVRFKSAFLSEKDDFPTRTRLISCCELEILRMLDSYVYGKSNILNSYGPGNDLCFLYSDKHLTSIVDLWVSDVLTNEPVRYRLSLLSASVFLSFLHANGWLTNSSLELFFNSYDPVKPVF